VVTGFSRYHEYTLGTDLRALSREVVGLIVRVNSRRDKGAGAVAGARAAGVAAAVAAHCAGIEGLSQLRELSPPASRRSSACSSASRGIGTPANRGALSLSSLGSTAAPAIRSASPSCAVDRDIAELDAAGRQVRNVPMDVEALAVWCRAHGRPLDHAARAEYVTYFLQIAPAD